MKRLSSSASKQNWSWTSCSAAPVGVVVALGLWGSGCHPAVRGQPNGTTTTAKGKAADKGKGSDGEMKPFATLTAKATLRRGLFDTYQKGEELYLAIGKQQLGREFLLYSRIVQGVGSDPLISGYHLGGLQAPIVTFERHGDRLFLIQRPTQVTVPSDSPLRRAVEQSFGGAVLQAAAIESERPDGAALINIKSWLLGDLAPISRKVGVASSRSGSKEPSSPKPDRDRSYIDSVQGFADNLSLRARLTFSPDGTAPSGGPDSRYLSVLIGYELARLPTTAPPARAQDDRIGFFATTHLDPTASSPDFMVHQIWRWRLEVARSEGGLAVPKRPIIFYIDPSVPPEYRTIVKEGVEAWQPAFAAAGWSQAIRAELLPDGADPADLRYPTIRWDVSHSGLLGLATPVIDPRSGEILGATVHLSQNSVSHYRRQRPFFSAVSGRDGGSDGLGGEEPLDGQRFAEQREDQQQLLRTALIADGVLLPNDPTPLRALTQDLKYTVMHEVGHALGLRHNFRASSDIDNARLADPAWVRSHGLTSSVMDYPGLNLPAGPAPAEWYYYSPTLGASDRFAITWGYSRDEKQASELARQAAQQGYLFFNDETDEDPNFEDPAAARWDLGSDPLGWAQQRAELIRTLWQRLPERMLSDGTSTGELTEALAGLLTSYRKTLSVAPHYLGGQYVSSDHHGDPGRRPPFRPVTKAKQLAALALLAQYAFSESALQFPPSLLQRLGAAPARGLNSSRPYFDLPMNEECATLQAGLLGQLLRRDTLLRLRHVELKYGPSEVLTLPELFDRLADDLWGELLGSVPRNVSSLRRQLQRRHLDLLGEMLLARDRDGSLPADLRALSRSQLLTIQRRLKGHEKAAAGLDAYTRAHHSELAVRISKLLDAHLTE